MFEYLSEEQKQLVLNDILSLHNSSSITEARKGLLDYDNIESGRKEVKVAPRALVKTDKDGNKTVPSWAKVRNVNKVKIGNGEKMTYDSALLRRANLLNGREIAKTIAMNKKQGYHPLDNGVKDAIEAEKKSKKEAKKLEANAFFGKEELNSK